MWARDPVLPTALSRLQSVYLTVIPVIKKFPSSLFTSLREVNTHQTGQVGSAVMSLTYISDVLGSNPVLNTGYRY
jgi:hypothetical protein